MQVSSMLGPSSASSQGATGHLSPHTMTTSNSRLSAGGSMHGSRGACVGSFPGWHDLSMSRYRQVGQAHHSITTPLLHDGMVVLQKNRRTVVPCGAVGIQPSILGVACLPASCRFQASVILWSSLHRITSQAGLIPGGAIYASIVDCVM